MCGLGPVADLLVLENCVAAFMDEAPRRARFIPFSTTPRALRIKYDLFVRIILSFSGGKVLVGDAYVVFYVSRTLQPSHKFGCVELNGIIHAGGLAPFVGDLFPFLICVI